MAAKRQEWTVRGMLEWSTAYFKKKGVPDARYSIEWLLAEILGLKRLDLYLQFDRPLSKKELNEIRPLIKRRAGHEPLQYITGETEFINARLKVTPDVLIPRPETEQLVEIILENHSVEKTCSALDIGTGSGCIAIALKMERPEWDVSAYDISNEALAVAKKNAIRNNATVNFKEHDIIEGVKSEFKESFDLVVSNPPYVLNEEKEMLEPQVVKFEPVTALFCDNIELMYSKIIQFSHSALKKEGHLYLEIHELQKEKILRFFDDRKWGAQSINDYQGKERFIQAGKREKR